MPSPNPSFLPAVLHRRSHRAAVLTAVLTAVSTAALVGAVASTVVVAPAGAQIAGVLTHPRVRRPARDSALGDSAARAGVTSAQTPEVAAQRLDIQAWVDSAAGALAESPPAPIPPPGSGSIFQPPPVPDSLRVPPPPAPGRARGQGQQRRRPTRRPRGATGTASPPNTPSDSTRPRNR